MSEEPYHRVCVRRYPRNDATPHSTPKKTLLSALFSLGDYLGITIIFLFIGLTIYGLTLLWDVLVNAYACTQHYLYFDQDYSCFASHCLTATIFILVPAFTISYLVYFIRNPAGAKTLPRRAIVFVIRQIRTFISNIERDSRPRN